MTFFIEESLRLRIINDRVKNYKYNNETKTKMAIVNGYDLLPTAS